MAKEYKIRTIQNNGPHDKIIDLRIEGLFVTIYTYPNGNIHVDAHDPHAKSVVIDQTSKYGPSIHMMFRKK